MTPSTRPVISLRRASMLANEVVGEVSFAALVRRQRALNLVDRLHAARAELKRVLEALAELPEAHKERVLARLLGEDGR